jgi:malate dehydrogenase (quinone)
MVSSADGTLSALLGASPGASTAAPIMIELLSTMFKQQAASAAWQSKLLEIIPSYRQRLEGNAELTNHIRAYTCRLLQLPYVAAGSAVGSAYFSSGSSVG